MMFTSIARGIYECPSESMPGIVHRIDLENKTCTCKQYFYTKFCKHLSHFGVKKNG